MYLYVVFAVVICTIFYIKRKYAYWMNKNVVGPKPIPFFGNLIESALRKKYIGSVYNEIYREYRDEKIVGIYRMTSPALIIRDLDIVKNILVKDFEVFSCRGLDFSKEGLGDNLFHCDSETWRALRRKLTPLFTSVRIKNAMPLLNKVADQFVNHVESLENNEQELRHLFEKYTMATIVSFAFGLEIDTMKENNIFATIDQHCFRTTYWSEADMVIPGIMKMTNQSMYDKTANQFCYDIVRRSIEIRKKFPEKRSDMINILLDFELDNKMPMRGDSGESLDSNNNIKNGSDDFKITDHVIAGQVLIFFIAGYGNNGSSLAYLMYYLARYPDAYKKLLIEIETVLQRYDGELTYEALNEMSYLEQVFHEVLRLHPLTNSIQRSSVMPYKIPGTDVTIDKGMSIVISPYAVHHDEKHYPNPEIFDPERFSPENSRNRHPYAFLAFGAGPRTCLGTRFGKLQFAVAAVKFLSRFRVELSNNTKPIEKYDPMRSLFYPVDGIRLNILPKNNS